MYPRRWWQDLGLMTRTDQIQRLTGILTTRSESWSSDPAVRSQDQKANHQTRLLMTRSRSWSPDQKADHQTLLLMTRSRSWSPADGAGQDVNGPPLETDHQIRSPITRPGSVNDQNLITRSCYPDQVWRLSGSVTRPTAQDWQHEDQLLGADGQLWASRDPGVPRRASSEVWRTAFWAGGRPLWPPAERAAVRGTAQRLVDILVADSFLGRGAPAVAARRASSCCCCWGEDSWLTVPADPAEPDWKETDIPESETGRSFQKAIMFISVLRIRCLFFYPWIRDPGWVKNQVPNPGWTTLVYILVRKATI